jgi:hypothetical protein
MTEESQEILMDIINKRLAERRRERFIEETLESENEYHNGNFVVGTSDELFKVLNI